MREAERGARRGGVHLLGAERALRPAIVALHGFGGCGLDFGALAAELTRPVVAPDFPGHGEGPLPAEGPAWELEAAARSTAESGLAAARGLGADRALPALLGYSMGGRAALTLACRDPAPWSALVLIGASAGLEDAAARAARAREDDALADRVLAMGAAAFAAEWARHPLIATQQRTPQPWLGQLTARRAAASAEGLARSLRGMGQGRMRPLHDALGGLSLPVLFITGADDPRYTELARDLARRTPGARQVVVEGAGHAPQLEQPRATARAIEAFLAGSPD